MPQLKRRKLEQQSETDLLGVSHDDDSPVPQQESNTNTIDSGTESENDDITNNEKDKIIATKADMPLNVKKYWKKRYSLFSKFDEGIILTEELWYSVTPEEVSIYLSKFIQHCYPDSSVILDLFCGGGGNSVQFAKYFDKVICIDINPVNLKCTEHNTGVYGKNRQRKLELYRCNWSYSTEYYLNNNYKNDKDIEEETIKEIKTTVSVFENLIESKIDIAFASPPWGGPDYSAEEVFDLQKSLYPLSLEELLKGLFKISNNVILFLPRNSDINQIQDITTKLKGANSKVRISNIYLYEGLKGILCFWGDAFTEYERQ